MNLAILQARMSSSRLPGKVLMPIAGLPMIIQQANRILRCKHIDKLIIATSIQPEDYEIVKSCNQHNIECFQGSLDNVLSRFVYLAKLNKADNIIRLTADCPLTDPEVIDLAIKTHVENQFDFTSNCHPRTYPDGLDVEVMTYKTLMIIDDNSSTQQELEHVTSYIDNHLDLFSIGNIQQNQDLSKLRWTVDLPEDYQFICNIYNSLYQINNNFNQQDILDYCTKEKHE